MNLYGVEFPVEDYCYAIGYQGPLKPDLGVIQGLARGQLMNIPFENFDVLNQNFVSLDPQDIIDKLLYQPRGGYCYELNGLFAMLLHHLKIPHSLLMARPMFYPELRPKTHMVLVAEIQHKLYLLDLGFGSYGPRAPIPLHQLDQTIEQDGEQFLLSQDEFGEYQLSALVEGEWKNQYAFNLSPNQWIDFVPANYFNSTHPNAIFTQKPLILLHTPNGRNILFGDQLKIINDKECAVKEIDEADREEILESYFGIALEENVPAPQS